MKLTKQISHNPRVVFLYIKRYPQFTFPVGMWHCVLIFVTGIPRGWGCGPRRGPSQRQHQQASHHGRLGPLQQLRRDAAVHRNLPGELPLRRCEGGAVSSSRRRDVLRPAGAQRHIRHRQPGQLRLQQGSGGPSGQCPCKNRRYDPQKAKQHSLPQLS